MTEQTSSRLEEAMASMQAAPDDVARRLRFHGEFLDTEVFVLLDDEATVKRVFFQRNRIALKPANHKAGYKTRYIRQFDKDVRAVGRVIGCIRTEVR